MRVVQPVLCGLLCQACMHSSSITVCTLCSKSALGRNHSDMHTCRDWKGKEDDLVAKTEAGLQLRVQAAVQLLQQREIEAHLQCKFGLHGEGPLPAVCCKLDDSCSLAQRLSTWRMTRVITPCCDECSQLSACAQYCCGQPQAGSPAVLWLSRAAAAAAWAAERRRTSPT